MRLERIDVAGGKSLGSVGLPPGGLPIDATTNGTKILWRSGTFGMTGAERLQVLKVDGTAAKRIAEFSPYAGERSSSRRGVYYARFVGDRHAITCNNYGRLALWKIGSSRPVYTIRLKLCLKPALSANDKHLALATEQGVYVLDPLSGRTMGSLPGNVHPNSTFSFRHDGLRLACLMQKELTVWDLRNGRQIRNIALPWKTTSEQLDWVADDYVMADAKYLIDVDRGAGRWYYRGISKGTCGVLGSRVWHVQKGRSVHMLCSVVLPHAEVRKSAGPAPKAGSSSANSGTPVSVKVSIRASSRDRSRIAQSLSSQLKKNGYKVASRQPLVLEASITPGKDAHVLYHKAWEFKSIHKVFKAQIHRLAFLQNGKILWEKKKTVRPHSRVEMRKGQSIEQAIAESLKPDLAFFTKTPIPTHVSASSSGKRGGSTGAVGRSKITDKGVVKD
jgi:hypothetical protein